MNKIIVKSVDVKDKIIEGIDTINDPIRITMSPLGGDVVYEDNNGFSYSTNDGATIAKNISVEDPIVDQTIKIIKSSSLKTNSEAGDGTSSTVLLSSLLTKGGLKLIELGYNPVKITKEFDKISSLIVKEASKQVVKVKDDNDLYYIASVSSSNNDEIAKNIVETIRVVGEEGQVFINNGHSTETRLEKEEGFVIRKGMFTNELTLVKGQAVANYKDVLTFITDKRLYYDIDAEKILSTAKEAGYKSIVIIASDFMGEALPFFVEQHKRGLMNILLIKEERPELLEDIAIYLGGSVVSDKSGALDSLDVEKHFVVTNKIFAKEDMTLISRYNETNPWLTKRVDSLKKQMKKVGDKDSLKYRELESRVSSLTRGMVTINVGGRTPIEINEKMYRYEDAFNATRVSLSSGYVVGGGISIYNAWQKVNKKGLDNVYVKLFNDYAEAIFKQISENCGINPDVNLFKLKEAQLEAGENWGYNAIKDEFSDLIEDGIIEPFKVLEQVVHNSVSIASILIKSTYRIVNKLEDKK